MPCLPWSISNNTSLHLLHCILSSYSLCCFLVCHYLSSLDFCLTFSVTLSLQVKTSFSFWSQNEHWALRGSHFECFFSHSLPVWWLPLIDCRSDEETDKVWARIFNRQYSFTGRTSPLSWFPFLTSSSSRNQDRQYFSSTVTLLLTQDSFPSGKRKRILNFMPSEQCKDSALFVERHVRLSRRWRMQTSLDLESELGLRMSN